MVDPLALTYPFTGRWMALNSPADRVPSHGTDLFGSTYAIDFLAVDARGRSAPWTLRALVSVEPPEPFLAFGVPILAPCAGTVVLAHDGEPDHVARRSLLSVASYLATQSARVARGAPGVAGNHVVIAVAPGGPFVLLAHLRAESVAVRVGDRVEAGEAIAACGNSGNSTQPHVHVQATDSLEWTTARGIPIAFAVPGGEHALPRSRRPFAVPARADRPEP
jgi:hypothetical protein